MGWCHEFGPQIAENCEHPMTAHADRCECAICGTVCKGRFAGCSAVWARGPREVSVDAPHTGPVEAVDRWRLPLEPVSRPAPTPAPAFFQVPVAEPPAPAPAPAPALTLVEPEQALPPISLVVEASEETDEETEEPLEDEFEYDEESELEEEYEYEYDDEIESPDVTTRYAVAQLEELNERIASLTEETSERTAVALDKVYAELRRLSSQREVDLTEQASGIFAAVQIGADALVAFTEAVTEITDDLRGMLDTALTAIGGVNGVAAWIAASTVEVTQTREEFAASLGKIERDLLLIRRRSNAEAKPAKLDDEQVHFIVDAVTDSVLAALENRAKKRR